MKLQEIADTIKGAYRKEDLSESVQTYQELTMKSLEPISFIDDRNLTTISPVEVIPFEELTQEGDIIVSLHFPMIACYVEEEQIGYAIPHYMAIIRLRPYINMDSRFIAQFINSSRGREVLGREVTSLYEIQPTTLPLTYLNNVDILRKQNEILSSL
ncbi:MAG: hypothetical protein KAG56_03740 [Sulfurovaceae bacterium]|nr:hypothetical protein [Sulfurovaceae bacterium]